MMYCIERIAVDRTGETIVETCVGDGTKVEEMRTELVNEYCDDEDFCEDSCGTFEVTVDGVDWICFKICVGESDYLRWKFLNN